MFIDQTASTFFFPYHVIRFLEIPEHEMAKHRASPRRAAGARAAAAAVQDDDAAYDRADDELPEDGVVLPVAVGAPEPAPDDGARARDRRGLPAAHPRHLSPSPARVDARAR